MNALELWYPLDRWYVFQKFGECHPSVCEFYKNVLGLNGHNGLDCMASHGQIVRAAHDGVVTFAGEDGSAGLGIVIRTHDKRKYGLDGAYFKTIYWHLKKGGIRIKAGDSVRVGDIIGECNSTGVSTGDHLHFGLKPMYQGEQDWEWWNAEQNNGYKGAIDPQPYFNGYFAKDAQTILDKYNAILSLLQRMIAALKAKQATPNP